ncbi:MAG: hypothetical protein A2X52_10540 [Candidatus Rokubacteria bacterium GWC2_70_16]|nr:MAG: hypothetical protein A2X52_10540 [Candidatus Rokubacteria bacterium GWC2_70_16]OGL15903.1 MAG: hypothetical protein A3K12_04650 [Candidatus Rokubacteria bacterium RIFCSPLOWO2_12_FULL_71_19]
MPRFYLRAEAGSGPRVTFDAQETRHLARVLRLGPGDVVQAVDGRGQELTVRLTRVDTRSAEGLILAREGGQRESPLHLTLVQGLPKGDKLETIIRMATELGVTRVVPVVTERTVVRTDAAHRAGRLARWQRVAREAAKQCGRTVIPEVAAARPLAEWLRDGRPDGLLLCLWEEERALLADRLPPAPVSAATLVVGPEGGLAASEVEGLGAAGAVVASLGPRVLRTETAGPVGLALLQARYGDLGAAPRTGSEARRQPAG